MYKDIKPAIKTLVRKEGSLRECEAFFKKNLYPLVEDGNRWGQINLPGQRVSELWCHD